jgi:hypothetical protein
VVKVNPTRSEPNRAARGLLNLLEGLYQGGVRRDQLSLKSFPECGELDVATRSEKQLSADLAFQVPQGLAHPGRR